MKYLASDLLLCSHSIFVTALVNLLFNDDAWILIVEASVILDPSNTNVGDLLFSFAADSHCPSFLWQKCYLLLISPCMDIVCLMLT